VLANVAFRPAIDRTLFIGRRSSEADIKVSEVYYELERLNSIMSKSSVAMDIQRVNELNNNRNKIVPQLDLIEYRRLEASEQMSSKVVAATLQQLTRVSDDPDPTKHIFDYPHKSSIHAFFAELRSSVFSGLDESRNESISWQSFVNLVSPFAPDDSFRGVERDERRRTSSGARSKGYDSPDTEWPDYCKSLFDELEQVYEEKRQRLAEAIRQSVESEYDATVDWLKDSIVRPLSGGERAGWSVGRAKATLASLIGEEGLVREATGKNGPEWLDRVRVDAPDVPEEVTAPEEALKKARAAMLDPQAEQQKESWLRRWPFAALCAVGVGVLAYLIVPNLLSAVDIRAGFIGSALIGIGVGIVVFWLVRVLQTGSGWKLRDLRREAERNVFGLYLIRLRHEATTVMWRELRRRLAVELVGTGVSSEEPVEGSMQRLNALLDGLREAGDILAIRAVNQAQTFERQPPCIAREVYPELVEMKMPDANRLIVPHLRDSLVVQPIGPKGEINDIRVGVNGALCRVTERPEGSQGEEEWDRSYQQFLIKLEELARSRLGEVGLLPATLRHALEEWAGPEQSAQQLAEMLADLHRAGIERRQAGMLQPVPDAPVWQRIIVGSPENHDLFNQAIEHCAPDVTLAIQRQQGNNQNLTEVVESANEGIAWVRLWVARDLADFQDFAEARAVYYHLNHAADTRQPPYRRRYSADTVVFHVLPETSAAAAIECESNRFRPLDAAVVLRLHGSDPRMDGPNLLFLFYFLRCRGVLVKSREAPTVGAEARDIVSLDLARLDGHVQDLRTRGQLLLSKSPTEVPAGQVTPDRIGARARQEFLSMFDAFHQFMTYDGNPASKATISRPGTGEITSQEWQHLGPSGVAHVQNSIRQLWRSEVLPQRPSDTDRQALSDLRSCMENLLATDVAVLAQTETDQEGFRESWQVACSSCFEAGFGQLAQD
jgi:hypothetical protein